MPANARRPPSAPGSGRTVADVVGKPASPAKSASGSKPRNATSPAGDPQANAPDENAPIGRSRMPRPVLFWGAAIACVAGLYLACQRALPLLMAHPQYQLTAEQIHVNPHPEWLQADVRAHVLLSCGVGGQLPGGQLPGGQLPGGQLSGGQLSGSQLPGSQLSGSQLSILDPALPNKLRDAFSLNPWVDRVIAIRKDYPPAVSIELAYRTPLAAIESPAAGGLELLPVDARGIHLPAEDLPQIKLRYLPRISNIVGRPAIGQPWDDSRVAGAVALVGALGDAWESLHLAEVVPSALPEIRDQHRFFTYDLVSRGGTRIIWGAAPDQAIPGEASFADKLARLHRCIAEIGPLDTVRSPAAVDVRQELEITPRTVKKPPAPGADAVLRK